MFLERYKLLISDNYNNYINNSTFITKDIYDFILTLVKKYKEEINAKILLQLENDDINHLKDLFFKMLDLIFDIKSDDYL